MDDGGTFGAGWYWIRFRTETVDPDNIRLSANIWTGQESDEPAGWTLGPLENLTTQPRTGYVGLYNSNRVSESYSDYDFFAVDITGGTASSSNCL